MPSSRCTSWSLDSTIIGTKSKTHAKNIKFWCKSQLQELLGVMWKTSTKERISLRVFIPCKEKKDASG